MRNVFISYLLQTATGMAAGNCVVWFDGTISSTNDIEVLRKQTQKAAGSPGAVMISFQILEPLE